MKIESHSDSLACQKPFAEDSEVDEASKRFPNEAKDFVDNHDEIQHMRIFMINGVSEWCLVATSPRRRRASAMANSIVFSTDPPQLISLSSATQRSNVTLPPSEPQDA